MNQESRIGNQIKTTNGFTLIELIVVISVLGILSVIGIAGYNSFNQSQIIKTSASDVATMLNLAKSRALSQIKLGPVASCGPSHELRRYEVRITSPATYALVIRCGPPLPASNTVFIDIKGLPKNVTFTSTQTFLFPVLTGGVTTGGDIVVSGYGHTRTIKIDSAGGIKIE